MQRLKNPSCNRQRQQDIVCVAKGVEDMLLMGNSKIVQWKQWILFPPGASSVLPTRVPYEESSIYSEQNFYSPDPSIAHELYGARVVTLRPGDVLFVPQRWWHYVENLTSAISINVWLPLEQDDEVRLEEGLTRLFVSQLCKDLPVALHTSLLNPNEDDIADMPLSVLLSQLKNCISKCHSDSGGPPDSKKTKLQQESCHTALSEYSDTMEVVQPVSQIVLRSLFEGKIAALQDHSAINISTSSEDELPRKIINAFCQPNIIALVRQNLLSSTVPT